MAVVGRQVRVAASEDAVIAVQRDVIVDPQLGRAVEVERVAIAVDAGDGRIAVAEQQRIVGVATQPQHKPAIGAPPSTYSATTPASTTNSDEMGLATICCLVLLCLICFPIFLPLCLLYYCCCAMLSD